MADPFELEFYGATREVTGSCHILRIGNRQILLECGLVQGGRARDARNREPFPFAAAQIDAVVLSHAHIDHSGRLPLLIHRGYGGPIYVQETTARFCDIMLRDSARLAEGDAERENRKRERKDQALVKPLYTIGEVEQTLRQFITLPYLERREILPGIAIRYVDAGHILGSASVEVWLKHAGVERKLNFSGDLGQYGTPILKDPARNTEADLVLMESTYGNRLHRDRTATVSELAAPFDMQLPSFVQHLSVLARSRLVKSKKRGRVRTYEIAPARFKVVEDWLTARRRLWEARLDRFDQYVTQLKEKGSGS